MSIEIMGGGSSGGMELSGTIDFGGYIFSCIDSTGKWYRRELAPSGYDRLRIYDKKMNLLQTIEPSLKDVLCGSPDGYLLTNTAGDGVEIRTLTGTKKGEFAKPNTYESNFAYRNGELMWWNPVNNNLEILNELGQLLLSVGVVSSDARWQLNKKKNFICMSMSASSPNKLYKVDKNRVITTVSNIIGASAILDLQNW